MTHSKTAAIWSPPTVIATLFLAGCVTGDHGVKRTASAGAWRRRRGRARIPRPESASPGSRQRWREPWGLRRPRFSARPARGIRQCGTWSGTIFGSRGEREETVTDEILLIVLAGAWLFVHLIAHGLSQWAAAGNTWAFGSRDDPPRETLLSGRLRRAFANYLETLPAALVVLIAAELSDRTNEFTTYGGWIWFGSRVVYLPAYASGIRWLRSIVWGVATVAIAMMALGLILGVS